MISKIRTGRTRWRPGNGSRARIYWRPSPVSAAPHGPRSFGQLRAGLPSLSDKVLADRLTSLQRRGLLDRQEHRGFPTRCVYSLTSAGEQLRPLRIELYRTGEQLQRHGTQPMTLVVGPGSRAARTVR